MDEEEKEMYRKLDKAEKYFKRLEEGDQDAEETEEEDVGPKMRDGDAFEDFVVFHYKDGQPIKWIAKQVGVDEISVEEVLLEKDLLGNSENKEVEK